MNLSYYMHKKGTTTDCRTFFMEYYMWLFHFLEVNVCHVVRVVATLVVA